MAVFLILIIIPCLIALVVVLLKLKSKGKETEPKPKPTEYVISKPVEPETGPKQNTIYAYSTRGVSYRCPFCDGENDAKARVCVICGRDI